MGDIYALDAEALRGRLLAAAGPGWPSVEDAVAYAAESHEGLMRKGSGEPCLNHLLRTAVILVELAEQRDHDVLCAGLLHDVVEDTPKSVDEVEDRFGHRVGDLVRALTHPDRKPDESEFKRNMRWFEAMRWEGRDVHLVKCADRLDNLRTMDGVFNEERRASYLRETREALLPLALAANTALYHALEAALQTAGE